MRLYLPTGQAAVHDSRTFEGWRHENWHYICNMATNNKFSETGSNPFYLNRDDTVKHFSLNDTTNPQYGLLDSLTKFILIENSIEIEQPIMEQEFIIENRPTK